jgi:transposase-like protein
MPGSPKRRALREEAERRYSQSERDAIVDRSEQPGMSMAAVSREMDIPAMTIRQWKKRKRDREAAGAVAEQRAALDVKLLEGTPPERRRQEAEQARLASIKAFDTASGLLDRGLASESRNAATVAGIWAERAEALERAARAEEEHQNRLDSEQGRMVVQAVERMFADMGQLLPRAYGQAVLSSWPDPVDAKLIAGARAELERPLRARLEAELRAEMENRLESELSIARERLEAELADRRDSEDAGDHGEAVAPVSSASTGDDHPVITLPREREGLRFPLTPGPMAA